MKLHIIDKITVFIMIAAAIIAIAGCKREEDIRREEAGHAAAPVAAAPSPDNRPDQTFETITGRLKSANYCDGMTTATFDEGHVLFIKGYWASWQLGNCYEMKRMGKDSDSSEWNKYESTSCSSSSYSSYSVGQ